MLVLHISGQSTHIDIAWQTRIKDSLNLLLQNDLNQGMAYCEAALPKAESAPEFRIFLLIKKGNIAAQQRKSEVSYEALAQARQLALATPSDTLLPIVSVGLAQWHYRFGKPDSTLWYAEEAVRLLAKDPRWKRKADAFEQLGTAYINLEEYDKAAAAFNEAYQISSRYKDNNYIARIRLNIGVMHYMTGADIKAYDAYKEAESAARKAQDKGLLSVILANLGEISYYLSTKDRKLQSAYLVKSAAYYREALHIIEQTGRITDLCQIAAYLARSLTDAGKNRDALQVFEAYEVYFHQYATEDDWLLYWMTKGKALQKTGQTDEAIEAYSKSLQYIRSNTSTDRIQIISNLAELYTDKKDYEQAAAQYKAALEESESLHQVRDSIYQVQNLDKLAEMEVNLELDKNKEIASLERSRSRQLSMLIAALTIILLVGTIASILLIRSREQLRRAKIIIEDQLRSIKQQKEDIEQLASLKNRIFSQISHDIRTPIMLAKIPAELLNDNYKHELSEGPLYLLSILGRNLQRLEQFVHEISTLSESDKIDQTPEPKLLNIHAFATDIRKELDLISNKEHIAFNLILDISPGTEYLFLDLNKIEKILLNLIMNAFKYTPEGGQITLSIRTERLNREGCVFQCSVLDSGHGIPEQELPNIFKWQFRGVQAGATEGLGIGLAISSQMAGLMGGKLSVENHPEGGAKFSFYLPCKCKADRLSSTAPIPMMAALPTYKAASNRDVLHLIEDDPDIRSALQQGLQDEFDVR